MKCNKERRWESLCSVLSKKIGRFFKILSNNSSNYSALSPNSDIRSETVTENYHTDGTAHACPASDCRQTGAAGSGVAETLPNCCKNVLRFHLTFICSNFSDTQEKETSRPSLPLATPSLPPLIAAGLSFIFTCINPTRRLYSDKAAAYNLRWLLLRLYLLLNRYLNCAVAAHKTCSSDELLIEYERSKSSAECCCMGRCCVLLGLAVKNGKATGKIYCPQIYNLLHHADH